MSARGVVKTISISGPDGCGKSTLIESLKIQYEKNGRVVEVLRSRPIGFPILSTLKYGSRATKMAASQNHKFKKSGTAFSSFMRFSYYYMDYLFGSLLIWIKVRLGVIIIFDRYYFDYICDQNRFSLLVKPSIARALYRLIHKPEKNIYLRADFSDVMKNRNEQTETQFLQCAAKYEALFQLYARAHPGKYTVIDGLNQDTLKNVEQFIERKV
jgi:thymidylate kinase